MHSKTHLAKNLIPGSNFQKSGSLEVFVLVLRSLGK